MERRSAPTGALPDDVAIRRAVDDDADEIADVYLASFRTTYAFAGIHTDDDVRRWVRETVVVSEETWVVVDPDGSIAGFMALDGDQLDQLYLRPGRTGHGIGGRLLHLAMTRRPAGLSLYTFQVNLGARRFYERHGFTVTALGDGSGNEEGQPDVRYEWLPAVGRTGP
jgi:GNAT superfamily N-acetyltransferase